MSTTTAIAQLPQQILLLLPSGVSVILQCSSSISYASLLSEVCCREALSPADVRLSIGTKEIQCDNDLAIALNNILLKCESDPSSQGDFFIVNSKLRLLGGKGGFGALLRGGPTGIIVKKTTNFSSCRDLNGRRLRNVEKERRIMGKYIFPSSFTFYSLFTSYISNSNI
jgi:hypothetical protein